MVPPPKYVNEVASIILHNVGPLYTHASIGSISYGRATTTVANSILVPKCCKRGLSTLPDSSPQGFSIVDKILFVS